MRKSGIKQKAYLAEIKQFATLYAIIMDSAMKGEITQEELNQILWTKNELAKLYEALILEPKGSVEPFLDILLTEVIANDTVPTSILRLAIKSLIKVFDCINAENLVGYNP